MNSNSVILEGIISIEAAIDSENREILEVFIDKEKVKKRDRKAVYFTSLLKKKEIPYTLCDREHIDSLTAGNTHGGFAARVSERSYSSLSELLDSLNDGEYVTMLDGVEDPFNFGYSIRNLFAFGCRGFIIPERNWMSAANIVARASAGASERCLFAVSKDDADLVSLLKEKKIDIVCSALSPESVSLFNFRPSYAFVLFIGGEKRGISKEIFENADKVVHIPYSNENAKYSLPTASCAAIFGSYLSSLK